MYSRIRFFAVLSALTCALTLEIFVVGCRKSSCDETLPSIQITSPSSAATFYFHESIPIRAIVTDDLQLKSITLEITDSQNNRYLAAEAYTPGGNRFEIDHTLQHDDLYLSSGTYYVRITANDGENEQIAFREIQLMEAPRTIEKIFAVRVAGSNSTIDSLHEESLIPCINFSGIINFGGIESRTKQLVAASSNPASLVSLSLPFFESIPVTFPTSNDELTACYHDRIQHRFIWGTQSGNTWSTSAIGTQLLSASLSNTPITFIMRSPQYIITISNAGNTSFVNVLRSDNGVSETSISVDWEIKGAVYLPAENNRILLVGNQNGAAHFAWLNLSTSSINEVFNFYESSPIRGVYASENNDFFVIHDAGIARYYNVLNNYTLNNTLVPERLVYDDLENQVWAITPQTLYRLEATGQSVLQSIPTSNLTDLWIQYNK